MKTLRIGSRGSPLALTQSRWVQLQLQENYPDCEVTLNIIKTSGDKILDKPLPEIGGKGLFTKEIEDALLRDEIDLAVHSLKDLPTVMPQGLAIAAVPVREDPRDVLVSRNGLAFTALAADARVGTGSLRRQAQLQHRRGDLAFLPIRGNVDTRLRKLHDGEYDAVVMAAAGLKRIGRQGEITEYFSDEMCVSAAGQGALAIETCVDRAARGVVAFLHDAAAHAEVIAERVLLDRLGGGCHVPIGARARVRGASIALVGIVAHPGGMPLFRAEASGAMADAEQIGESVAEALLRQGAGDILAH